MLINFNKDVAI